MSTKKAFRLGDRKRTLSSRTTFLANVLVSGLLKQTPPIIFSFFLLKRVVRIQPRASSLTKHDNFLPEWNAPSSTHGCTQFPS